jgi:hypothetical protein
LAVGFMFSVALFPRRPRGTVSSARSCQDGRRWAGLAGLLTFLPALVIVIGTCIMLLALNMLPLSGGRCHVIVLLKPIQIVEPRRSSMAVFRAVVIAIISRLRRGKHEWPLSKSTCSRSMSALTLAVQRGPRSELCGVHSQEVIFSRVGRRSKLNSTLGMVTIASQILQRSRGPDFFSPPTACRRGARASTAGR